METKKIINLYIKINPIKKSMCISALKIAKRYGIEKKIKNIESSFAKTNYWKLFFLIGFYSKKTKIYEHGVLHGYSLISFAIGKLLSGSHENVIGQDLFEKYQFNKSSYAKIKNKINKLKLNKIVILKVKNLMIKCDYKKNIFKLKKINKKGIHMIDLSNCGEIVKSAIKNTDWEKVNFLIFEGGGSKKRDEVSWMKKQNRKKIMPVLDVYKKKGFEVLTLNYFPSLSIVKKIK